ncbi:MoxR family ATPase [Saccharibacillus sp. CPCC 101409]|uniref:AAA family ATPase n=1 Tax=Saccharibacillus sp. CPCC 101409 TaxID=3058041 RepID=UPI002672FCCE|nr:MoxR family ATPase [Saccharibacillus sp. CPCC 101409]MDO3408657.1 MoxR family ATPase [Saccharibacillus sp. CPCC 101409]
MLRETERIETWKRTMEEVREEIARVIVGQEETVEQMLWCVFAGGHALLEGIPGLGKTMLVRSTADALDLPFSRIQFTPDLMPSDITGTDIIHFGGPEGASGEFRRGPLFGSIVLADEINRATPKTQSALLEAMQEKTVTVGGVTHKLPEPFFVLATQNPLENEGTYPLPEAQLDRFLLKLDVDYPSADELKEIIRRTTAADSRQAVRRADAAALLDIQRGAKEVLVAEDVLDYAVRLLLMTHPAQAESPDSVKRYVRFGSGPRGLQAMVSVSKVRAIAKGRMHVSTGDIRAAAKPALRHRLLLGFEGQAEGVSTDMLVDEILDRLENKR